MTLSPSGRLPANGITIETSRHFPAWLAEQRIGLAVSAYQSGKLFLIGLKPDGRLSVFERNFNRCMGLWSDGQTLWMATAFQLWRLENMLPAGEAVDGFDRLYVPRLGYTTADVDVHDVAIGAHGQPVFVSTLFSSLGTLSERYNFAPLWKPPFISRCAAEDRCHLNGLAMHDGQPAYVTACAQTDVSDGWREHRETGGCVIDVQSDELVAQGLSMPHSPRLHDDRLWLCNSGQGDFGYLDPASGHFEPVAFCPGYARGLAFSGQNAIIGLSRARSDQTFSGLPLQARLAEKQVSPRCGLQIVDLKTGDTRHWLRLQGPVEEIYDVAVLPDVVRPKALGFKTDEIRHSVWLDIDGATQSWSAQPRS